MNKRLFRAGFILCMALLFLNLGGNHVQAEAFPVEINGVPYADLQTAVCNVNDGETITLLDNIVLDMLRKMVCIRR